MTWHDAVQCDKTDSNPMYEAASITQLPTVSAMDHPVDTFVRKLIRLCAIVGETSGISGKLVQLGIQVGGSGVGYIREDMYLNNVPHSRYVRQYFYDMATEAVLEAVVKCSRGELTNRMKMVALIPELNPSMDSYR